MLITTLVHVIYICMTLRSTGVDHSLPIPTSPAPPIALPGIQSSSTFRLHDCGVHYHGDRAPERPPLPHLLALAWPLAFKPNEPRRHQSTTAPRAAAPTTAEKAAVSKILRRLLICDLRSPRRKRWNRTLCVLSTQVVSLIHIKALHCSFGSLHTIVTCNFGC